MTLHSLGRGRIRRDALCYMKQDATDKRDEEESRARSDALQLGAVPFTTQEEILLAVHARRNGEEHEKPKYVSEERQDRCRIRT